MGTDQSVDCAACSHCPRCPQSKHGIRDPDRINGTGATKLTDYGQSFRAARLFEKVSGKGNTYFTGRMGGVRVTLLKSNEVGDGGEAIWSLMFAEAPAIKPDSADKSDSKPPALRNGPSAAARSASQKPLVATEKRGPPTLSDIDIPF